MYGHCFIFTPEGTAILKAVVYISNYEERHFINSL